MVGGVIAFYQLGYGIAELARLSFFLTPRPGQQLHPRASQDRDRIDR